MDVDELAPRVGHAGDFADGAGAVEVLEPGIAVGMHPAAEPGQMVFAVLADWNDPVTEVRPSS